MALGEQRFGQRQDHPPLDQFLRLLKAAQLVPEAWADDPPAEAGDRLRRLRARRERALDMHERGVGLVAAALEPVARPAVRRRNACHVAGAALGELGLQVLQKAVGDLGRVALGNRHTIDPGGRGRRRAENHADEPPVGLGDHGHGVLGSDQRHSFVNAQPVAAPRTQRAASQSCNTALRSCGV